MRKKRGGDMQSALHRAPRASLATSPFAMASKPVPDDYVYAHCFATPKTQEEREEEQRAYARYNNLIPTIPLETGWRTVPLRLYQGFWVIERFLPGLMAMQEQFKSQPNDVLLASQMKSGSGWLRALVFATVHRGRYEARAENHPLRRMHAQDSAAFLEGLFTMGQFPDLNVLPSPRLLATHAPFSMLPESLKRGSDVRIVYICREPKDGLVSMWHFMNAKVPETEEPISLAKAFELFSTGAAMYGPVWEHQLEYWRESLQRPEKVLFLKYENLMAEPGSVLRRLAEFLGCQFSDEEEREGIVEEIVRLCSFENLSSLEVNSVGERFGRKSASFFRRGEVGDWVIYLAPEMAQQLDAITSHKLQASGLSFSGN